MLETTFKIIEEYYNDSLTVSENYDWMKLVLPFPISLIYLNQYVHERGKRTDPHKLTDTEVFNLLRSDLSIEKNLELIRERNLNVKRTDYPKS